MTRWLAMVAVGCIVAAFFVAIVALGSAHNFRACASVCGEAGVREVSSGGDCLCGKAGRP